MILTSFLDNILDVFNEGIYISDLYGKTVKINTAYEKLTGLKKEEVIGHYVQDLEKDGTYNVALNPSVVKTGKPKTTIQNTKTGRNVVLDSHPVFDQDNNVAFVITFVRDVTLLTQLKDQISHQADMIEKFYNEANFLRSKKFIDRPIIESPKMKELENLLRRVAATDSTVLILGETGVGKDVFATQLHQNSPRRNEPFFKINCATIPESLIESELFGYESGAFSGASSKGKPGIFEMSDQGTLFLDEIGELPLSMQAKLLRVLQDQEVMRIGSTKVRKVDVRFIAATNRNLMQSVKEGTFRSDLFYRLRVAVLDIPPLRERNEEIIPLINYFLNKFNTKYKKKISFSHKARNILLNYRWPGNVREIENLILGLIVTQDKEMLDIADLPNYIYDNGESIDKNLFNQYFTMNDSSLEEMLVEYEKDILRNAMDVYGSASKAAQRLKVDKSTIFRKLKKYSLR